MQVRTVTRSAWNAAQEKGNEAVKAELKRAKEEGLIRIVDDPKTDGGAPAPDYGMRHNPGDGKKGNGFLGPIPTKDGGVMTEASVGISIDGKEIDVPTLVPTLSKEEVKWMADGGNVTDGSPTAGCRARPPMADTDAYPVALPPRMQPNP